MKKTLLYIFSILILAIMTCYGTYAFFNATITSSTLNATSSEIDIIYTKGEPISGYLNLSTDKNGGLNTTISLRLSETSLRVKADFYISIDEISEEIANNLLKWEVYEINSGIENKLSEGTFANCTMPDETIQRCQAGSELYILKNYQLSTTLSSLKIYIWLDGENATNEVLGARLNAGIEAKSENIKVNLT